MITELTRAVQRRQTVNPRTVLGFFATVLAIVLTGGVGSITVLATTKVATYLIPWLFVFCGGLSLLLLVGVFLVTYFDPSRLMLGQITGTEYAEIQKAVLGDSLRGERTALVAGTASVAVEASSRPEVIGFESESK